MNQMTKQICDRWPYDAPEVEKVDLGFSSVICTSPTDGESEDIGFEDWNY